MKPCTGSGSDDFESGVGSGGGADAEVPKEIAVAIHDCESRTGERSTGGEVAFDETRRLDDQCTRRTEDVLRMKNATGCCAHDFQRRAGEGTAERNNAAADGDALSSGAAGVEVGAAGELVEVVIPDHFLGGGVTVRKTRSFEGRNPEIIAGAIAGPTECSATGESVLGVEDATGGGADDFEGFTGRRGADTDRFVGGVIDEACGVDDENVSGGGAGEFLEYDGAGGS